MGHTNKPVFLRNIFENLFPIIRYGWRRAASLEPPLWHFKKICLEFLTTFVSYLFNPMSSQNENSLVISVCENLYDFSFILSARLLHLAGVLHGKDDAEHHDQYWHSGHRRRSNVSGKNDDSCILLTTEASECRRERGRRRRNRKSWKRVFWWPRPRHEQSWTTPARFSSQC